jgi:hypothetical protein
MSAEGRSLGPLACRRAIGMGRPRNDEHAEEYQNPRHRSSFPETIATPALLYEKPKSDEYRPGTMRRGLGGRIQLLTLLDELS